MTEDQKKLLTEAQARHLQALNAAFLSARQRLELFVAYLRDEYDAPASGWDLMGEGFKEKGES